MAVHFSPPLLAEDEDAGVLFDNALEAPYVQGQDATGVRESRTPASAVRSDPLKTGPVRPFANSQATR